MLKGVISMPSNIFATTGTNVSILFLEKNDKDTDIILIDATRKGKKVKEGKNQRTILSSEEMNEIVDTFTLKQNIEEYSIIVSNKDIIEKNYSFAAGQYFEVKMDFLDISEDEFNSKLNDSLLNLKKYFSDGEVISKNILEKLEEIKYE